MFLFRKIGFQVKPVLYDNGRCGWLNKELRNEQTVALGMIHQHPVDSVMLSWYPVAQDRRGYLMDLRKSVFLDIATLTVREWDRCVANDSPRYVELNQVIWSIIAEGLKVITGKSYIMARDEHGYGILNADDHLDVLWCEARADMPFDEETARIYGKKGAEARWADKDPDNVRNVKLPIKVSQREKEEIHPKAKEHGISVVELFVRAVREYK